MVNKFGITESKEMLLFMTKLANAADLALEDKDITLADSLFIFAPLRIAGEAIKDVNLVPQELGDLSLEETLELYLLVEDNLELRNELVKEISLDLLRLAGDFALVLRKIKAARANATSLTVDPNPVDEAPGEDS